MTKRKKTKRSEHPYPNLVRDLNLRSRFDFIDANYINGRRSVTKSGEMVLRPLTEEETEFLDKFYEEYIIATLDQEDENNVTSVDMKERAKKEEELKKEREELKVKLDKLDPIKDMEERNVLARRYADLKDEIRRYKPYKNDSYNRNNDRNNCIYNMTKSMNDLELRTWNDWDQNNIFDREYHDMELMAAYYSGILNDSEDEEES